MQFETICVVGLGYIGLPTAAAFAGRRKNVIGVDINQHAVDTAPAKPTRALRRQCTKVLINCCRARTHIQTPMISDCIKTATPPVKLARINRSAPSSESVAAR